MKLKKSLQTSWLFNARAETFGVTFADASGFWIDHSFPSLTF